MLGEKLWESKVAFGRCFEISLKGMMQICRISWKAEFAGVYAQARNVQKRIGFTLTSQGTMGPSRGFHQLRQSVCGKIYHYRIWLVLGTQPELATTAFSITCS